MKIVYVSREFGSITGGGIGTYIANVTQYMAKRGHEVYLVTDCFNDSNLHYLPSGVTLITTEPPVSDRQGCYFTWLQEYSDRVYQTLINLSKHTKLDVVEFSEYNAEGFISIRAKKLLNEFAETKLIVKLHTPRSLLIDINEESYKNYKTEIDIYAEDYSVTNADIVTSPSTALADYIEKRLGIFSYISPYPLELKNCNERVFTQIPAKKVIFVGSVQVRKGVDFFIEAAKMVLAKEPNFTFDIYGKDTFSAPFGQSYTEYLQKRIPENFSKSISFKGAVPYEQIYDIFLNSGFCVFPSRWENWPNVCLEAMSLGCVVIGSKHGGMSEMIKHGVSGFLVDPYKPEEIAYTILDNYTNHSYLQQISKTAQVTIKEWCDPDLACQQIESGYTVEIAPKYWIFNQEPKISVIIPLYNQGQYVQEAIDSLRESTYKNIEIIVVNDGSTDDNTNQIFEQLEGVVKLNKPNGGLSSARNAGIKASYGDFILPLDADDKIHHNFIADGIKCLQNNHDLDYICYGNKNFEMSSQTWHPINFIQNVSFLHNTIGSCSAIFRKFVFEDAGFYDEEMISYEDWDLFLRLNEKGFKGDVIPRNYLYYRVKPKSTSMLQSIGIPKSRMIIQHILRKHKDNLSKENIINIAQLLIDLWKTEEGQRWDDINWFTSKIATLEEKIQRVEYLKCVAEEKIQTVEYLKCVAEEKIQTIEFLKFVAQERIRAMESSKFWKIRKMWFKFKRKLGLTQEEL